MNFSFGIGAPAFSSDNSGSGKGPQRLSKKGKIAFVMTISILALLVGAILVEAWIYW